MWLYQQPDLRAEIERLRALQLERPSEVPARERAGEVSLRQRLQGLIDENRQLREQVAGLNAELAVAYGMAREAVTSSPRVVPQPTGCAGDGYGG